MQRHIQQQLIRDGVLTAAGLTRTPRPRTCPTCGAPTLAAIVAHTATTAAVDAAPTTSEGEFLATMRGLPTFYVTRAYGLEQRFATDITDISADTAAIVHATHQCGYTAAKHPKYRAPHSVTTKTDRIPF